MKKQPFNEEGVAQWLLKLYNSTIECQMEEQKLILICLQSWVTSRFEFTAEQVAYIESLSFDFKHNLAQEIVFAINNHQDIKLEKTTDHETSSTLSRDSVKVSEYETRKQQSATSNAGAAVTADHLAQGCVGYLTIRIYYKLI